MGSRIGCMGPVLHSDTMWKHQKQQPLGPEVSFQTSQPTVSLSNWVFEAKVWLWNEYSSWDSGTIRCGCGRQGLRSGMTAWGIYQNVYECLWGFELLNEPSKRDVAVFLPQVVESHYTGYASQSLQFNLALMSKTKTNKQKKTKQNKMCYKTTSKHHLDFEVSNKTCKNLPPFLLVFSLCINPRLDGHSHIQADQAWVSEAKSWPHLPLYHQPLGM